jgi:ethanolamine utilization protein EutA
MAETLLAALLARTLPPAIEQLFLTEPVRDFGRIHGVMLSGGVAEYVYRREERDFGDLGKRLGHALRRRIDAGFLPWPVLPAGECIRATALGASEYSVQLSGNTTFISAPGELLPRRNLQVLQPPVALGEVIDPDRLAAAIRRHFIAFDRREGEGEVALAFRWAGAPSYERVAAFAQGLRKALRNTIARRQPLFIMLDGDIAQTLGALLREELNVQSEILVIDGVTLMDFDYIDLGRVRLPSQTVPVTVKSLVFSRDPRAPHRHGHVHGEHVHGHGQPHPHEHHEHHEHAVDAGGK